MDLRRRLVFGAFLVLVGAGVWVFVVGPARGPSEREWAAQIEQDAVPLTQLLRYDFRVEEAGPVEAAWAKRRALYDEQHLAELRRRLLAFVEFQVGEYGDAKDIYLAARRPEVVSEPARAAQERLREAFPREADEMIEQYRKRVREVAYRASPKVATGEDPDLPKYDWIYDNVVGDWLPKARQRIESLTTR